MVSRLNITPQDICLFHVGGSGQYGPIDAILNQWPRRCVMVAIEARQDPGDVEVLKALGVRSMLVNACIAETTGRATFYVARHPESSSLLMPGGLGEHMGANLGDNIDRWDEQAATDHTTEVDTLSLMDLVGQLGVTPEVLSLDVQGMELPIMRGLGPFMRLVNVVVSEVEFHEVYQGQALFHDHMAFLHPNGFRLAALLNPQMWHPGPSAGQGFLTVAEALWFRTIESFLSIHLHNHDPHLGEQGVNLAAVAVAFDRFSYSYTLLKRLGEIVTPQRVMELCESAGYGFLVQLVKAIEEHMEDYQRDKKLFLQHLQVEWKGA